MQRADVFCCIACRLLQPPAVECNECNSPLMATVANQRALLAKSGGENMPKARIRSRLRELGGMLAGLVVPGTIMVGTTLWWPVIPIVFGAGIGAGITAGTVAALRRRAPIKPIELHPIRTGGAATMHRGVARQLTTTVSSLDGKPVLAEEVILRTGKGVLFRRVEAAPFLIELDGGGRLVVVGMVRLALPTTSQTVAASDPRMAELGIDVVRAAGELVVATLRDGDTVDVTGEPAAEIVPELASLRDAGASTVMRGRANAVVAIRAAS